ncbi:hypothetical protein R3W88_023745 [Solanum pinnatisectum]|uniref:Uncharacterized protein n=1 Tax=Solanum pinnatisectum TaxID=50273 RepID=A0AAV9M026_9SOLN|nr:hypothetical protein R3W88_023745 [Solanum pinnatisectum]
MAEEHEVQSPEGGRHQLCANNCGFFGNSTTENYCSKCYRDIEERKSDAKSIDSLFSPTKRRSENMIVKSIVLIPDLVEAAATQVVTPQSNRCLICKKKMGLMGFKCRCGTIFCGTHRYPEVHGCTFDFKSMGREAIAKANPLIKAEKLKKI